MQNHPLAEAAYNAIIALADEIQAQRERIVQLEGLLGDARTKIAKLNKASISGPPKSWQARD